MLWAFMSVVVRVSFWTGVRITTKEPKPQPLILFKVSYIQIGWRREHTIYLLSEICRAKRQITHVGQKCHATFSWNRGLKPELRSLSEDPEYITLLRV
jgi:hypothetical protein